MKKFVLLGSSLHLVLLPLLLFGVFPCGTADAVSYDGRSLIINGNRRILFSGSIHYPRSTPQMWPGLIAKAKEGGIDVIQTYVFWNVHEAVQGQFDFQGRKNLVGFIKEIQRQGLYVSLRIGPYIEGEWKYGGIPYWLHDVPGIVFRSDNEPFKQHMQNFVSTIVNMMEVESLYAPQGGPIILSQIENEYGNVEPAFHEKGPPYVRWAASMAVGLNTGVPWMMCKQDDAPGPVINACNGMDCGETFVGPNSPNKPAIWTENWTSFFQTYGTEPYVRSAQDIAYSVALFIAAKKGSFVNYYMYHGGTNFGRTAASYMITSYYDQAPLDEYGLIQQPKWGHLKELHSVIKACSETILFGAYSKLSRGKQEAHVFQETSGRCVAFIANRDPLNSANVQFRNNNYMLPRRSISILPDCKNVLYSTAKVSVQQSTRSANIVQRIQLGWQAYADVIPKVVGASFSENALLDQMTTTKDETDYLWYSISYKTTPGSNQHVLRVDSKAHIIHAFVNNVYLGNTHGDHKTGEINFEKPISLRDGDNDISLLSVMVGSPDSGAFLERRATGIHSVSIRNSGGSGALDISRNKWGYQTGLVGEKRKIYLATGLNNVVWGAIGNSISRPLMWYKTTFNAPTGNNPVALDLSSMGKGEVWINGESIGRYWVSFKTPKGQPSQSLYHIPSSFMKPSFNLLVLFEEMGGNPLGISLATISTRSAPVANDWNSWNSTREPLRTKYIYG